ncbi:MAG: tetratricopeptide repeat protein, partial [candidate division Zixibacteria bacterium]|nr:tetratricopeptide repeat protein [candidate division Zixibacteria bacterium]
DHRTSHRSDLFALGVIAYQLLSGRHPFVDEDPEPVKVNSRVCEQEPVSLLKLRPDLPEGVSRLVERLLAKSEEARPETGWEVCVELQRNGAEYPYHRLVRPGYMIRKDSGYSDTVATILSLAVTEEERVDELTDKNPDQLRLLLTANFACGRMTYDDGHFRFEGDIYWPARMRRNTLRLFSQASWREKKTAVLTSIAGRADEADRIDLPHDKTKSSLPRALPSLLLPLLRSRTVTRISARLAPAAARRNAHAAATQLHLQAGNLGEAERCAELAAHEFTRNDRKFDALAMLLSIDRYARLLRREFEVRRVLLLKGNIHKDSGELDAAETTYRRIIRLYEGCQPDRLLAETHKYLGDLYRLRQDSKAALDALEKSLAVFRELGDELEISHTLTNIGNVHWIANDTRGALKHYRAAYKIQKRLDAKADVASTLHNIATTYCFDGRIKRSIFLLNHTLHLKKEIGHLGEIARTLNNLGYAYQLIGSPSKAVESLTEALDINRRIGSKKELLYNLENLVSLKISAGQLRESQVLLEEGLFLAGTQNLATHEGPFHLHAATIAKRQGNYAEAVRALGRVDHILETLDDCSLGLLASVQKASMRFHLGDSASALEIARRVYDESLRIRNSATELESLLLLPRLTSDPGYWEAANRIVSKRRLVREKRILCYGRVEFLLDQGHSSDAAALARDHLIGLDKADQDLELPWMRILAARIYIAQDDPDRARLLLQAAHHQARETGLRPEMIMSLTLLGQIAENKGNYEEAYVSFKQALSVCREVAVNIDGDADRHLFLGRPLVRSLSEEIKSLGRRLGQKERADR